MGRPSGASADPCVAEPKLLLVQDARERRSIHLVFSIVLLRQDRENKGSWVTRAVAYSGQIMEECFHDFILGFLEV